MQNRHPGDAAPQRLVDWVSPYIMSASQLTNFSAAMPGYNVIVGRHAKPHGHPRIALEREITESEMSHYAITLSGGRVDHKHGHVAIPGNRYILDVGGTTKRYHARRLADFVHVLQAPCEVGDYVRQLQRQPDSITHHVGLAPDHKSIDGAAMCISVHVYGLAPSTILSCLSRTTGPFMMAVHHYDRDTDPSLCSGKFYGGECSWSLEGTSLVMKADGGSAYHHELPTWVYTNRTYDDGKLAMEWSEWRTFGYTRVYMFALRPTALPASIVPIVFHPRCLTDPADYGDYTSGLPPKGLPLVTSRMHSHPLMVTKLVSLGPLVIVGSSELRHVTIPKSTLALLSRTMRYKPRNAKTLNTLVAVAQSHVKSLNVSEVTKDNIVLYAVPLALYNQRATETALLSDAIAESLFDDSAHEAALDLRIGPCQAVQRAARWVGWDNVARCAGLLAALLLFVLVPDARALIYGRRSLLSGLCSWLDLSADFALIWGAPKYYLITVAMCACGLSNLSSFTYAPLAEETAKRRHWSIAIIIALVEFSREPTVFRVFLGLVHCLETRLPLATAVFMHRLHNFLAIAAFILLPLELVEPTMWIATACELWYLFTTVELHSPASFDSVAQAGYTETRGITVRAKTDISATGEILPPHPATQFLPLDLYATLEPKQSVHVQAFASSSTCTAFAKSAENCEAAIRGRAQLDNHDSPAHEGSFREFVMHYRDSLMPGWSKRLVVPSDEDFIAGQTGSARVELENALAEFIATARMLTRPDLLSQIFMKHELVVTDHQDGRVSTKHPRAITTRRPMFKLALGPWSEALSKRLRQILSMNHWLTYAIGYDGAQLGSWFEACDGAGLHCCVERDCSNWDSTMGRHKLLTEIFLFDMFGAAKHRPLSGDYTIHDILLASINKAGYTRFGQYYTTVGTRASGDYITTSGSTLRNLLTGAYVYCTSTGCMPDALHAAMTKAAPIYRQISGGDDDFACAATMKAVKRLVVFPTVESPGGSEICSTVPCPTADDAKDRLQGFALLSLESETKRVHVAPGHNVTEDYKGDVDWDTCFTAFGFRPKTKFHSSPLLGTFYSSRPYPTKDGLVLGVTIGRALSRSGHSINQKLGDEAWLRCIALQYSKTWAHVPVLRVVAKHLLRVTEKKSAADRQRLDEAAARLALLDHSTPHKLHVSRPYECDTARASALIYAVYGADMFYLEDLVDAVCSGPLPWDFSEPIYRQLLDVDL